MSAYHIKVDKAVVCTLQFSVKRAYLNCTTFGKIYGCRKVKGKLLMPKNRGERLSALPVVPPYKIQLLSHYMLPPEHPHVTLSPTMYDKAWTVRSRLTMC